MKSAGFALKIILQGNIISPALADIVVMISPRHSAICIALILLIIHKIAIKQVIHCKCYAQIFHRLAIKP